MKKRSGCVKNEKDLSSEDQSILVQHRMLLGLWFQPVLRKRSWMPEYIRICQSYDPSSEEWTVDRYNRRWIMCTVCGRIKQDAQMSYYGGKGGANRGVCADCSRNGRS